MDKSKDLTGKKVRRWCYTWFYGELTHDEILAKIAKCGFTFSIFGYEICESTGRPHTQGYMEFNSSKRYDTLWKMLPCHWDICGGDCNHNINYCSKGLQTKAEWLELGVKGPNYGIDAKVFKEGNPTQQGKRTDITEAMESIKNGMSELEVFEKHTHVACAYMRPLEKYRFLCEKVKSRGFNKKDIRVYWGDSETGKTRSATELFPDDHFILRETTTGFWWDGYDGETCVIVEEFLGNAPLSQLLGWTDGYACQVKVNCSMRWLMAKVIIFTSNVDPEDWYKGVSEERRHAFMRRINEIKHFKR